MSELYPLRFKPIFKDYIWGGDRLSKLFGKDTGPGIWAESWEIVDHTNGQSVVIAGELAGKSLSELLDAHGPQILGESHYQRICQEIVPENLRGRFPLLLKFLDANRVLSVQVHPDDTMGATLSPPDLGKTEAWYVIDAQPDSKIYAGLKEGVSEEDLRTAVDAGKTEDALHSFTPNAGDCVFIKAGTMHAIGAGLMVCEIQQASDTTFRLFDWNRMGNDGKPRPLHIEQGIQATDFSMGPISPSNPEPVDENTLRLVSCDKFVLEQVTTNDVITIGGDGKMCIVAMIDGDASVENDPVQSPFATGQSMLIPANSGPNQFTPRRESTFLKIHLPE